MHLNTRHRSLDGSLLNETRPDKMPMLPRSAFTCATEMKTKRTHTSDKYQEINKNKVSKPNERLFIIGLVMSLAPSAQSFPPISPSNRASHRRHSNQELCCCRVTGCLYRGSSVLSARVVMEGSREKRRTSSSDVKCSDFTNLLMICDPFVDGEIVKSCTHNFSLNLYYSHHNRASHSISKC